MVDRCAFRAITSVGICLVLLGCSGRSDQLQPVAFQNDVPSAMVVAKKERKPLAVIFFRQDCRWSKMFEDSTLASPLVAQMAEKVVFAKIDAAVDTMAVKNYGVSFYPTTILFKSSGDEIDRLVGFFPPADFYNEIQLFLQGRETLTDYLERLKDEPDNRVYLLAVADKYRGRSDWQNAIAFYQRVLAINQPDTQYHARALFDLATAQAEIGDYREALRSLSEFLQRFPGASQVEEVLRKMAYYKASVGDTAAAIADYKRYLKAYSDSPHAEWVRQRLDELLHFYRRSDDSVRQTAS